jgi:hypothetical protein
MTCANGTDLSVMGQSRPCPLVQAFELSTEWLRLLREPASWQPAAELALNELIKTVGAIGVNGSKGPYYVGYRGSFGDNHATPRTLRANKIGQMVCLEGIVTRCMHFLSLVNETILIASAPRQSGSTKDARVYPLLPDDDKLSSTRVHGSTFVCRCDRRSCHVCDLPYARC